MIGASLFLVVVLLGPWVLIALAPLFALVLAALWRRAGKLGHDILLEHIQRRRDLNRARCANLC